MRLWLQSRIRILIVAFVASSLALAYFGSYYQLSRRGMREARDFGLDGFLYVPFEQAAAQEDLSRHSALAFFYAPANWIDRRLFNGIGPVDCIIWRLSG